MSPKLYWITNSPSGRLAISARPRGGDWLEDEIESWRGQGVDVVVSLLTLSESKELELGKEASFAESKGIQFFSFPIEDRGIPVSSSKLEELLVQLSSEMQRGKSVAIHCRQGIGRSSLVSAALLVSAGDDLAQALKTISGVRGVDVPETSEQRRWLEQFASGHVSAHLTRQDR